MCIYYAYAVLLQRLLFFAEVEYCFPVLMFQRILSLETLRERNNQQLLVKEQELQTMRNQLTARGGEVGAQSLQHRDRPRERELNLKLIPALKTTTVQSHHNRH